MNGETRPLGNAGNEKQNEPRKKIIAFKIFCILMVAGTVPFFVLSILIKSDTESYSFNWLAVCRVLLQSVTFSLQYAGLCDAIALFLLSIIGFFGARKASRTTILFVCANDREFILCLIFRPSVVAAEVAGLVQSESSMIALTALSAALSLFLVCPSFFAYATHPATPITCPADSDIPCPFDPRGNTALEGCSVACCEVAGLELLSTGNLRSDVDVDFVVFNTHTTKLK